MASRIVTYGVKLDENATQVVESVAAMLKAQNEEASIDAIVSNAVRIAYGEKVRDLTKAAKPRRPSQAPASDSWRT